MALISCPQCGKKISNKATSCMNCGYKLEPKLATKKVKKRKMMIVILFVAITVAAIAVPKLVNQKSIEKKDAYAAQTVNKLYKALDQVSAEVSNAPATQMGSICAQAKKATDTFDALPIDYESEMSDFVKQLQQNSAYLYFKSQYMTGQAFAKVGTDNFSLSLSGGYAVITQRLIASIEVQRPSLCSEYQ